MDTLNEPTERKEMLTATYSMNTYLAQLGFKVEMKLSIDDPTMPFQLIATKDNMSYTISIMDDDLGNLCQNMNVWYIVRRDGKIVDTQQQFYVRRDIQSVENYSKLAVQDLKKVLYRNGF